MVILIWLCCGAVFGWLAAQVTVVRTSGTRTLYLVIGMAGATLGGLLNGLFTDHPSPYHLWNIESWATAVMGSSRLLSAVTRKKGH